MAENTEPDTIEFVKKVKSGVRVLTYGMDKYANLIKLVFVTV